MKRSSLLALALTLGLAGLAHADTSPGKKSGKKGAPAAAGPVVIIETSLGTIKAELNPAKAPLSVKNFLEYVDAKFYDGTIFHRVISTFMIQGGGFDKSMKQKETRAPIKNEGQNGLKNARGTLAMARTSIPDSATSQFFINVVDNGMLDFPSPDGVGYAVFGKVTEGLDVVDKIKATPTGLKGGMRDVPTTVVEIKSIRRAGK